MKNAALTLLFFGIMSGCSGSNKYSIVGKWEVIDADLLPFEHISFCEKLNKGAVFEFRGNGVLRVFESKDSPTNCNDKQSYKRSGKSLQFREWDMIWDYEVLEIGEDILRFRIDRVPEYIYSEDTLIIDEGRIDRISKNGNVIQLKRL